jgi:hypothetical protein
MNTGNGSNSTTWPTTGFGVGIRRFASSGTGTDYGYNLCLNGTAVAVCGIANGDATALQISSSGATDWTYTLVGANTQYFTDILPHSGGYFVVGSDDTQGVIVNLSPTGARQGWPASGNELVGIRHFVNQQSSLYFELGLDPVDEEPYTFGVRYTSGDAETVLYRVAGDGNVLQLGSTDTASNDFPETLVTDTMGRVTVVCQSQTGPTQTTVSRYGFLYFVNPTQYTVVSGTEFQGGLAQLANSDNRYLELFNDETSLTASVEFRAFLSAELRTPLVMTVTYEAAVTRPGLSEQLRVFNDQLNLFQTRIGITASQNDVFRHSSNAAAPANDIRGADGRVRIQLIWDPINDEDPTQDGWIHRLDLVQWVIVD